MSAEPSPFEPAPQKEPAELPCDDRAEKALVGSFLLAPVAVGGLCAEAGVTPEWFYHPAHATMYAALTDMWKAGKGIDVVTLTRWLMDRRVLANAGGAAGVSDALTYTPSATNASAYIDTLREKYTLRRVVLDCAALTRRAYEEQEDVPGLVEAFGAAASSLTDHRKSGAKSTKDAVIEKLQRMEEDQPPVTTIATGLAKLDLRSPLCFGDMPLIAAEKKAGKTGLAISIACNVADEGGLPVLVFSLEDKQAKFIDRCAAKVCRVPIHRHHKSRVNNGELDRLSRGLMKLAKLPLTIRDDVHDLSGIVAVARQWHAKNGRGLIVVDYAQLVKAKTRKQDTRETEVATVSRTLRLLSIELDCAMIVLSQLNKDGDTRESKALENDCTAMWKVEELEEENTRRLVIPFQRNGESRVRFKLTFLGELSSYENYAGAGDEDCQDEEERKKKPAHKHKGAAQYITR